MRLEGLGGQIAQMKDFTVECFVAFHAPETSNALYRALFSFDAGWPVRVLLPGSQPYNSWVTDPGGGNRRFYNYYPTMYVRQAKAVYSCQRHFTDGFWHHVAYAYDSRYGRLNVYFDYRLRGTMEFPRGTATSEDVLLGATPGREDLTFNGCVSCFRVSDAALTPKSFLCVSDDERGTMCDTVATWAFDGLTAEDYPDVENTRDCFYRFDVLPFSNPEAFTLETYVLVNALPRSGDAARGATVFGKGKTDGAKGPFDWVLYLLKDGRLNLRACTDNGREVSCTSERPGSLADGREHHVAVTYEPANRTIRLFVDHQPVGSPCVLPSPLRYSQTYYSFGGGLNGTECLDGRFSEARLSRRALDPKDFLPPKNLLKRLWLGLR